MKLDSTTQRIGAVGLGAVLLLALAWYFVLWSPQGHDLKNAKAAKATAETQISTLDSQIAGLQAIVRSKPADQVALKKFTQAIPDNPQLPQAFDDLQTVADANHVTMSVIGPGGAPVGSAAPTQYNGVPALAMTITATGAYQDVLSFVTALDNMPRTVVITNLSISGGGASKGVAANTYNAQIASYVFYAGQPTP
ncbi:MAG TPA: type 4a pilus biogenesis protein PilO [Acidimicrobiales bacterium]|jgi:Tfp pilus assembly protein PilO|nr:type 4a pilus biogenesis protein PilO [Acidimicrobiales bacterium]